MDNVFRRARTRTARRARHQLSRPPRPQRVTRPDRRGDGMRRAFGVVVALSAAVAATVIALTGSASAASGFHVSNGRLLDGGGQDFVMRGVNHPFIWFQSQNSSFAAIKSAGANTVRVVLNRQAGVAQVQTAVTQCKNNKLACVLEVHDTTGYAPGNGAASLTQAADWWLSVKSAFVNEQNYVIVNLGNEPYASSTDTGWVSQTQTAISKLRGGGITNALMVDGPGYGQDPNNMMGQNASNILSGDPQHNVIFSVHMYSVYGSSQTVTNYINYFADRGLPLVVGEFGHHLGSSAVAWQTVLSQTRARNIGWMAWSWSGNGGSDAQLDMTNNFNAGSLTGWGNDVVNGTNGLKQAGQPQASVYGGTTGSTGTTSTGSSRAVVGQQSGRCLDVNGQATANGSRVQVWDCNGQDNQKWTVGSDGSFRGQQSGRCLGVAGQATANGSAVTIADCTGQAGQKWTVGSDGSVRGQQSGRCLDVSGQAVANGTAVILWDCSGQANQKWRLS